MGGDFAVSNRKETSMTARTCLAVLAVASAMVLANVAQAVEVTHTFKGEGTPLGTADFTLPDTTTQSFSGTNPPIPLATESGTAWSDYIYGGYRLGPPLGTEGQWGLSWLKPDLSQIPFTPGNDLVTNVELDLNIYRRAPGSTGTIGLALITQANVLTESSIKCASGGPGDGAGCVDWTQHSSGFPFLTVDGGSTPVIYGATDYTVDASDSTANTISGPTLNALVKDILDGTTAYHGFLVIEETSGDIGWCAAPGSAGGFCDAAYSPELRVSTDIPEPASLAMLGIGGAMLLIRRRRA
jgi:hypothetical protein